MQSRRHGGNRRKMTSETALNRRIRRHVTGPTQDFFAVAGPGLEAVCSRELTAMGGDISVAKQVFGGVEFSGRVYDCYRANLWISTAGRILMRIGAFRADSFAMLEKRVKAFPWELYLRPGSEPVINAATHQSRLYHKQAISERFSAGIADRLTRLGLSGSDGDKTSSIPQIYVRASHDHFVLSLDSSGTNLHKRVIKTSGGSAPIRETIAAAALILAVYTGTEPLLDPLCGTGTFSLEAAMKVKQMPPGWFRGFGFMDWPCFRPRQLAHIRREAESSFLDSPRPMVFASDINEKSVKQLHAIVRDQHLSDVIQVARRDFLDITRSDLPGPRGLVVINPPYGRRIGTLLGSEKLFQEICLKLRSEFSGWKVILVAFNRRMSEQVGYKTVSHRFLHGGLNLRLLIGRIP